MAKLEIFGIANKNESSKKKAKSCFIVLLIFFRNVLRK